jgi:hypothetical protein
MLAYLVSVARLSSFLGSPFSGDSTADMERSQFHTTTKGKKKQPRPRPD